MRSITTAARRRTLVAAALLAFTLPAISGCVVTQKDVIKLPTLRDVEPTGPEGRRCYDRCAQAEANCKHMCPSDRGICDDDCVLDTKLCLYDCPELRRPEAPAPAAH